MIDDAQRLKNLWRWLDAIGAEMAAQSAVNRRRRDVIRRRYRLGWRP